uniref:Uncharacterized protein n=1 Tax=Leptospira santarosai serovar Arenal str. MAVJ 401 TaxID=1049976 RepID=M6JHB6_9LEPT|nr:hypothetical protein LEP1GSC063_1119 [Leptospira santarosai serovar Arenal str. MAVJ 401]
MKTIAKYLPRSDLCKPISFLLEKNSKKSDQTKTSFRKIGTELSFLICGRFYSQRTNPKFEIRMKDGLET